MSNYTIDQLMQYRAYEELSDILINIAKDDDMRNKLESILYKGEMGDFSLKSSLQCRDNPLIESARRISMAFLLIDSPNTFDYVSHNNINIFHGTNSNALPTILKYGMNSVNEQKKKGIQTCSGEEWSRIGGERDFVSFTDVLETAMYYTFTSFEEKDTSFGIIIGTCEDEIKKAGTITVHSSLSEIGVRELDIDSIKLICVPEDKVDFVRRLVGNRDIKVMGFDGMNDKFYYFDDSFLLEYSMSSLEEYKNKVSKKNKFSKEEVAELAAGRPFDRIFKVINKISNFFNRGEYDEHIR